MPTIVPPTRWVLARFSLLKYATPAAVIFLLVACPAASQESRQVAPDPVDTISVDVITPIEGVDCKPYLDRVSASLHQKWFSSFGPDKKRSDRGIVFVRAAVQRNGKLQPGSPMMELPSGNHTLDDASLTTVRAAAPFDALPRNRQLGTAGHISLFVLAGRPV